MTDLRARGEHRNAPAVRVRTPAEPHPPIPCHVSAASLSNSRTVWRLNARHSRPDEDHPQPI